MQKITLKTKLLTALLALCMLLSLVPFTAFAANSTVSNEAELKAALENADCAEIKLGGNIETASELRVNRTVTLDLNGRTVELGDTALTVAADGKLTVKDSDSAGGGALTTDGESTLQVSGGTLTLENAEGGGTLVTIRLPAEH